MLLLRRLPSSTLFLYTTLFRSPLLVHPNTANGCGRSVRKSAPICSNFQGNLPIAIELKLNLIDHFPNRSEEHTSELQSRGHLVCRLLLENKNLGSTS